MVLLPLRGASPGPKGQGCRGGRGSPFLNGRPWGWPWPLPGLGFAAQEAAFAVPTGDSLSLRGWPHGLLNWHTSLWAYCAFWLHSESEMSSYFPLWETLHTHTHTHTHTHLSSPPHTWMLTGSNSHSVTHPHTPPQQEQILKIHANCPPSRGSAEQVCCHQRQRCPETEFNLHLRHLFLPYASHAHKPQYIWYRKMGRMARPCVSARPQSRKCCVLGWMKSDPVARTWTQEVA